MIIQSIKNKHVGDLTIMELQYSITYRGAMACSFDEEITNRIIAGTTAQYEESYNRKLQLIESPNTQKSDYFDNLDFLKTHIVLPTWTCIASFGSSWNDDVNADYYKGSTIHVLWFQDDCPYPVNHPDEISDLKVQFKSSKPSINLADHAIKGISEIHWKKLATKYSNDF